MVDNLYVDLGLAEVNAAEQQGLQVMADVARRQALYDMFKASKGWGNRYQLLEDADEGTGGFEDGSYLVPHKREKNFLERQKYSVYLNYVKPILDARVDPVFERKANRTGITDKRFDGFQDDCDGRGTRWESFLKTVTRKATRDGVAFVIVDSSEYQPDTLDVVLSKRLFPYVYIREAGRCCYAEIDGYGCITKIAFTEVMRDANGNPQKVYKVWTKQKWTIYGKMSKGGNFREVLKRGTVSIGVMPVIPVYMREHDPEDVLPVPPLYDIARVNFGVYNISSEIREIQRNQGFSLLAYPGKLPPEVVVGSKNALTYSEDSKNRPEYLSPSADIQKNFAMERDTYIVEIYRMAALLGVMGRMKTDSSNQGAATPQSGVAKEWEFKATNSVLSATAERCETAEKNILAVFGSYIALDFTAYRVTYPREFGVIDIMDEMNRAEVAFSLGMGADFEMRVRERIARAYFPELDDAAIKKMMADAQQVADDAKASAQLQLNAQLQLKQLEQGGDPNNLNDPTNANNRKNNQPAKDTPAQE